MIDMLGLAEGEPDPLARHRRRATASVLRRAHGPLEAVELLAALGLLGKQARQDCATPEEAERTLGLLLQMQEEAGTP